MDSRVDSGGQRGKGQSKKGEANANGCFSR